MSERPTFKPIENDPGSNEPLFSPEELLAMQEYAARRREQAKHDVGERAISAVTPIPPQIYRPPRIARPNEAGLQPPRIVRLTETAPPRIARPPETIMPTDQSVVAVVDEPIEVIPAMAPVDEEYKPRHAKPEQLDEMPAVEQPVPKTEQLPLEALPEAGADTSEDTRELAPAQLRESFASVGQIAHQIQQFNTGPFSKLDATAMRTLGAKLDTIRAALYADSRGDASKFSRAKQALNFAPNTPVSEIQARLRSVARDLEKQYKF